MTLKGIINPYLKIVAGLVGCDHSLLSLFTLQAFPVFHAQYTVIASAVQILEYILVVDLSCGGLFSAGRVAEVEAGNLIPGLVDVGDQVAFCDLLVIEVVDDFAAGASNRLADLIGLRDLGQEEARMVPGI